MNAQVYGPGLNSVRVLIVDDHALVRDALRDLIERETDLTVCGLAATAAETLDALGRLDPDVIVLDLSLEDSDGAQLIRDIQARSSKVRVLVLSAYEESTHAERCLRAGARGFVNKRAAGDDIRRAIRVVADGGLFVGRAADPQRITRAPGHERETEAGPEALSDRELEVFQHLGRGMGPSHIAAVMGVSIKTIEGYSARIKVKLGLAGAEELRRFAVDWYRGTGRH